MVCINMAKNMLPPFAACVEAVMHCTLNNRLWKNNESEAVQTIYVLLNYRRGKLVSCFYIKQSNSEPLFGLVKALCLWLYLQPVH